MMRLTVAILALGLLGGMVTAQNVKSDSKSSSKTVIVISKDGKTYKKVIENGKVIEESGDKSIAGGAKVDVDIDIEDLLGKALRGKGSSKTKSRRIVLKNGKKVIDEESGDLDWDEMGLPGEIEDVLKRLKAGRFEFDFGGKGKDGKFKLDFGGKGKDGEFEFDFGGKKGGKAGVRMRRGKRELFGPGGRKFDVDIEIPDLPDNVRKMLKGMNIEIPDIEVEIPEIEIENGELPDSVRKMLEKLNVEVPKLDATRRRTERSVGEDLESEIKRLKRRIDELQRQLEKSGGDEEGEEERSSLPVRLRKVLGGR
ncbi:MAG: hypothetical protein CMJ83_00215 [Planctomycetes bacterium]|nr:hypothetical protein [Planctomycetota bacterium]